MYQKLNHANEQKNIPTKSENDDTRAIQLKLQERMNKGQI